eukprot:1808415-Rhodomonas_salina.3
MQSTRNIDHDDHEGAGEDVEPPTSPNGEAQVEFDASFSALTHSRTMRNREIGRMMHFTDRGQTLIDEDSRVLSFDMPPPTSYTRKRNKTLMSM